MKHNGPSVVIVGAGATGRGHVGQLARESGCHLAFLDKDAELCGKLQEAGSYSVTLISAKTRTVTIDDFEIFHTSRGQDFYPSFRDASVLFTAVCPGNIREAADWLRSHFIRWLEESGPDSCKNVLCCENMDRSSTTFRKFLLEGFPTALRERVEKQVGFADTMVARVVARPTNPLELLGEEYSEWTADRMALRGPEMPAIRTLELVDDQARFLHRKLYIHNAGHATFGYLGFLRGFTWIHEAGQDPEIRSVCEKAIEESGWAIQREFGFPETVISRYREALIEKCGSPALPDAIHRVVREPIRKLGRDERFFGPIGLMLKHGRQPEFLLYGICAALLSRIPYDAQSGRIAALLGEKGIDCLHGIVGEPVAEPVLARIRALLPVVRDRFERRR